jgi:two-component system LytT family response regulator
MKVLIVDDESKARSLLNTMLIEYCEDDLEIFQAESLKVCLEIIKKEVIDLVFLDIEMPQFSGLQLFEFISPEDINFEIVFTTAYSEYAIQAFEFSAIDYLLKPLRPNKIVDTLAKAKKAISQNQVQLRLLELKRALNSEKFSKLALPVEDGVEFVKLSDIFACEADGMYTKFYLSDNKTTLISKPLKYFTDLLENREMFYKPHRSHLVNLSYLNKIVKKDGTYIELENKMRIPVSKEKKDDLLRIINTLNS